MLSKVKLALFVVNAASGPPTYETIELPHLPAEGSYIAHPVKGESQLLRVLAVVHSADGVDVHAINEGEISTELDSVLTEKQSRLSRVDRVLLWHIFELSKKGKGKFEKDTIEAKQEVLEQGFELYYEDILSIVDRSEVSRAECRLVLDVLSMYRALDRFDAGHKGHPLGDHSWIRFSGFDGNNETELLNLTRFIIETKGHFAELKPDFDGNGGNSHYPVADIYRRMAVVWNSLPSKHTLGPTEAQRVLDASGG